MPRTVKEKKAASKKAEAKIKVPKTAKSKKTIKKEEAPASVPAPSEEKQGIIKDFDGRGQFAHPCSGLRGGGVCGFGVAGGQCRAAQVRWRESFE